MIRYLCLRKMTGRCGSVENNPDGKLARVLTGSISGVELRGSNEAVGCLFHVLLTL